MDTMIIVWTVLVVVFLVAEGATPGLVSIWFAAGALVALGSAFLSFPIWSQALIFVVVSVASLLLTRPLARKYVNRKTQPTNADKVIGATATVTERIDNIEATGAVLVGGRTWTARSSTGEIIEKGSLTKIKSIEGVKLIVTLLPQTEMAGKYTRITV